MGNQTETVVRADGGWDRELVPDVAGRTQRPDPDCPVEVALAAVSGRWTTLVLRELLHGPCSFTELRRRLPTLSAKVLTERLTELQARGLVGRSRAPGFPARTEYAVTERGRALRPLLISLYQTGQALAATSPPR
ncbi:winged helix-turn-helix transcriptional regulator [Actinoalloteichus spitiensis]|uniref:winged helix-turn-helix transcriptional regulator n=1 Tax=Actinoalloteichus spitiensis TaxID=252394 RepID=UPI001FE0EBE9|nr:helix-turn-helix domain-containing protein [Actinoalloteichus spitiensis]